MPFSPTGSSPPRSHALGQSASPPMEFERRADMTARREIVPFGVVGPDSNGTVPPALTRSFSFGRGGGTVGIEGTGETSQADAAEPSSSALTLAHRGRAQGGTMGFSLSSSATGTGLAQETMGSVGRRALVPFGAITPSLGNRSSGPPVLVQRFPSGTDAGRSDSPEAWGFEGQSLPSMVSDPADRVEGGQRRGFADSSRA
jgi:hypothetical protein